MLRSKVPVFQGFQKISGLSGHCLYCMFQNGIHRPTLEFDAVARLQSKSSGVSGASKNIQIVCGIVSRSCLRPESIAEIRNPDQRSIQKLAAAIDHLVCHLLSSIMDNIQFPRLPLNAKPRSDNVMVFSSRAWTYSEWLLKNDRIR
jgi:hypothetical protein